MDEILSSIRQIIADDDAGSRRVAPPPPPANTPNPAMTLRPQVAMPVEAAPEPLPLSASQIVADEPDDEADEGAEPLSFQSILAKDAGESAMAEAELVDPEDVAFESDPEPAPQPAPPPAPAFTPRTPPRPSASISRVAPMPDPRLSADLAERLIEPATRAAVQNNFARLNSLSQVPAGQTIDGMMRDMLRPMLKAWLDEHLPAVVERMVEKEIARVSRGIE